jgi:hypothetical protein
MKVAPGQLERVITRSSKLGAAERLEVYANAYYARLMECLGDVYPVLKRMLGEEVFNDFGFDYLQSFPSRSYTLNLLGARFADFLVENRPPRDDPDGPDWADFVVDLARFEWDIYIVFDGPGMENRPPFPAELLAKIAEDRLPQIQLQPAPCLRLTASRFPVNDYYTSAKHAPGGETVETPPPQESYAALTRRNFIVRRYPLTQPQFGLLAEIAGGKSLGAAMEASMTNDDMGCAVDPTQVQEWFRFWTAEGFFAGIEDRSGLAGI